MSRRDLRAKPKTLLPARDLPGPSSLSAAGRLGSEDLKPWKPVSSLDGDGQKSLKRKGLLHLNVAKGWCSVGVQKEFKLYANICYRYLIDIL